MKNIHSSYKIRSLLLQDINQAIRLSNAEKWNQTEQDWALLIGSPGNIALAALDGDKIIGTSTAIIYANDVAWIGMVLVDKNYRGRGVSKMLLIAIFEQLQSCGSIKLDATPAGQAVYETMDFKDEYLIHRMTTGSVSANLLLNEEQEEFSVEHVHLSDLSDLVEYDQHVFGANRTQLTYFLFKNYPEKCWVLKRNDRIAGIALGREGTRFHHIGPVMASSTEDAKQLVNSSLKQLNGLPVVIDVLDSKTDLIVWLNSIGFEKQRHFIRMYKNENPYPGNPENQYLICGPEFG